MNVLFYICVETDSGDLTWERVYMYLWEEFPNVHLLMIGFNCPEVTLCG